MDIPAIETFLCVAKKQSFSLTAETLYLSQPAISKRIASLESELNYQLFDRIKKKIILTEAGRLFLPRAQKIIDEVQSGKNALAEMGGIVAGELAMLTSHHIGLHHLPPVLKQYVYEYPQVNLKLDFMNSEAACLAVENAEIELAVTTLPNNPATCLKLVKIWSDPMTICINNYHPILENKHLEKNASIDFTAHDLKELTQFPVILPEKGTYTRELLDEYFSKFSLELNVKLSNNYLETIKMMVSVGLGWSVLPQTLVDDSLIAINTPSLSANRSLGIITHKKRSLSPAAQKMIDLITQYR
ncbi:LysR family transcriptional regulator [sulfur-oxidizing endosymbiont of Gigantopelta aegis]|uniref:LysR family transcriptional regulator n=1 Tax=sulfur-oxidizing endosymbiont of Gigantopelta aegis TaxID=2794934 RepID=UPI0018DDACCC|nr:LysR family transcriptional regulator [sulfur-oxidizing endosymbiont of Gigantopelta aegis]